MIARFNNSINTYKEKWKESVKYIKEKQWLYEKDCGTKSAFAGKQYIRIAIRDRADNAYLVEALKELA